MCFSLFKAFGRDMGKPFSSKRVPRNASPLHRAFFLLTPHPSRLKRRATFPRGGRLSRSTLCFSLFKTFGRGMGKPFSPKRVPRNASPLHRAFFLLTPHPSRLTPCHLPPRGKAFEEHHVFLLIQSFWEGYGEALFTEKGSPKTRPRVFRAKCRSGRCCPR